MDTQKINEIRFTLPKAQRIIDSIAKLDEDAKEIAGESAKFFGVNNENDKYENPLSRWAIFGIENLDEYKSRFIDRVVGTWETALVPNLEISAEKIIEGQTITFNGEHGKPEKREMEVKEIPRIEWLFGLFLEKYVKNAEKLSRDKILEDARRYVSMSYEQRNTHTFPKVSEIVNKKTLKLTANTYSYGDAQIYQQDEAKRTLTRLIGVVNGLSAINAGPCPNEYYISRFYKNGRFDMKLLDEALALKVATVLVEGWKEK